MWRPENPGAERSTHEDKARAHGGDDLLAELSRLEREGLLTLMWHGTEDFTAVTTPRGAQASKESSASEEE